MSIVPKRSSLRAVGPMLLTALCGCVVTGGGYEGDLGYDEDVGVSVVGGIFAPYEYDYGGWDQGYYVGPPRGGEPRSGRPPHDGGPGAGRPPHPGPSPHPGRAPHPYQPAPHSKPTPSIPTRPRSR